MRAPPSLSGYQIFDTLVPRELCLQLRGRDDPATAVPACVVGGFLPLAFVFSLLSLYSVSLDIDPGFSKWIAEALVVLASPFTFLLVDLSSLLQFIGGFLQLVPEVLLLTTLMHGLWFASIVEIIVRLFVVSLQLQGLRPL